MADIRFVVQGAVCGAVIMMALLALSSLF